MSSLASRRNLVDRGGENFKPPVFKPNTSLRNRMENWLRRFLDLQAGTAWRDLREELRGARGRLLDIGCGAQIYRGLVPADVAYSGIDTADARVRFGYETPDTHYFEGEDWGTPDGAFDIALCTEVLEHIAQPATLLAQAYRCLRPGGRLVMTVPFAARWHYIPYDYWRYTPSSLNILLTEAGFADVNVRARGNPLTVACYKAMTLHLMLLFSASWIGRGLGLLLSPALAALATLANLTIEGDWGDDCLGYTVTASRPTP